MCMHKLVSEPLALTCYSNVELIKLAGSQGVELLMWPTARGALTGRVSSVHSNYHIPTSNTADGLLVLKNRCASSPSNIGVSNWYCVPQLPSGSVDSSRGIFARLICSEAP